MNRHGSMNRIYRLVWSVARNVFIPVAETARGRGKRSTPKLVAAALSLSCAIVQASPSGGQVVAGTGSITQAGATTTITQATQNLSLTWTNFNIAPEQTVNFVQPSTSAIAVNRILGTNGTQILGTLHANGQVFLINPNGIVFGPNAEVNVGGLVASTLDLNAAGNTDNIKSFSGTGNGSVINQGTISATPGGYVVLLGNHISNEGVISAQLGTVALGAGSVVTLTFDGNSRLHLQVEQSVLNSLTENGGLLRADGGQVIMTAGARDTLLASAVNNTGVIEARTVDTHDGNITLLGGMTAGTVHVGGTLDASAPLGGDGGQIDTSAAHVEVAGGTRVTTAARDGLFGSWLIDPEDYSVAALGGDITGVDLSSNLGTTDVVLQSSAGAKTPGGLGDVNMNDVVTWSANTTLTLTASNSVNVNANITATGNTAGLIINTNTTNTTAGATQTQTGLGTFNLTGAAITLSGTTPFLSIGGTTYTVINTLGAPGSMTGTDLQGMNGNLTKNYALGSNIDASATSLSTWNGGAGFTPIGSVGNSLYGTFDGLGHTITGLTINLPTTFQVGLFGGLAAGAIVQNVGLIGGRVYGDWDVGGLVGFNNGTVRNSYTTGSVTGDRGVGGLVGLNAGTISNSYATGAVTGSFFIGGLVGQSAGTISNSYATGNVGGSSYTSGGLAGDNYGGSISYSYAIGSVNTAAGNGGLIGLNSGTISHSYWNLTTNPTLPGVGSGSAIGSAGLSTTAMQSAASFGGFVFTATPGAGGNNWVMVDSDGTLNNAAAAPGATFPMLSSEYSTTVSNAHQLQLIAMAQGANYTLASDIDASATALATTSGSGDVWSTRGGFAPIANFSGSFDGQNHTINDLTINLAEPNVGLFALTSGAAEIQNVGLVGGSVRGGAGTGELVGNNGPGNSVSNSYATGTVSGGAGTGGLIGSNTTGSISGSYATGSVTGAAGTGGLIGSNTTGAVSDSYATGSVIGAAGTGGLIGSNTSAAISTSYATGNVTGAAGTGGLIGSSTSGPISNSYATGNVNGGAGAGVGGLIGSNTSGTVTNTYSAGSVSGTGAGVGALLGSSDAGVVTASYWDNTKSIVQISAGGGVGMTTAQMMTQANFVSPTAANGLTDPTWDFSNTWVMYEGLTYPLLSGYMSVLAVTANDVSRIYGQMTPAFSVSYSTTPSADLFGTVSYGGAAQGASNVGSYAIAPSGLYSNQQGYILHYANGSLNITPAPLTVSGESAANKVYDGTFAATLSGGTLIGVVSGDTVNLTQTGSFDAKNAASNISVTATDALSGASAGNYTLVEPLGLTANITPASLSVSGESAANKVYDDTVTAALSGGTLIGVVSGDTVNLTQTGSFDAKNAASNISVTATDALSGASAGNYTLVEPLGLTANITPASLSVSGESAANKVYDGTVTAALSGGTLSGVVFGDTVNLTQTGNFNAKNVATDIPVTATDTLMGSSAGNYTLVEPLGLTANITPASLSVSGESAANKVYDGTVTAALSGGTLSGVVFGSDTVTLTESGSFISKNVANNISVTATDALSGASAGNYTLVEPLGLTANITPATLIYVAATASFAAGQAPSGLKGTLEGFVAGDTQLNATTGPLTWTTTADASSGPGRYPIEGSGLTASNYVFIDATANATALTLMTPIASPSGPTAPSGPSVPSSPSTAALLKAQNVVTSIEANLPSSQADIQLAMLDVSTNIAVTQSLDVDTVIPQEPADSIVADRKVLHTAMVPSLRVVRGGVRLPDDAGDFIWR